MPTAAGLVSEDEVKEAVRAHLESRGYEVAVAWGRSHGIDLHATGPEGRIAIEAKGDVPSRPQQTNYSIGALGELVQRMSDPEASYGLALPDVRVFRAPTHGPQPRGPLPAVSTTIPRGNTRWPPLSAWWKDVGATGCTLLPWSRRLTDSRATPTSGVELHRSPPQAEESFMSPLKQVRTWIASAVVIAVAAVVIGDTSATATQGQAILAGQTNTSTAETVLQDTSVSVQCVPVFGAGLLACGSNGLEGSGNTYGVYGSGDVAGVRGASSAGDGVAGDTSAGTSAGVFGENFGGGNGVYGLSISTGNGVQGETGSDIASGVYGQNDGSGYGVAGRANGGVGVLADSTNGTALDVNGKARFSRSGLITISYPAKTAVISGLPLTNKSLVLATIQRFLAGVYVVAASPTLSGSSNSFTIYLNKAPGTSSNPKSVTVGWEVIEHP